MSLKGNANTENKLQGKVVMPKTINGYSAYELAVIHGFEGTEEEWLASLPQNAAAEVKKGFEENAEFIFFGGNATDIEDVGIVKTLESAEYPGCYYRIVNGEDEWINPPMIADVEYRTTERYAGDPVYVKRVEMSELPLAGEQKLYLYSASRANPIRFEGYIVTAKDGYCRNLPYINAMGIIQATMLITGFNISVSAHNYDLSSDSGWAIVYYTKK